MIKSWKGGGGFWDDVNGRFPPEDLVLTTRREGLAWVHSEWCLLNCPDARLSRCRKETVETDLGGHRQVCGPRSQENSIEAVCQGTQDGARHDSKILTCFSVVLVNTTT